MSDPGTIAAETALANRALGAAGQSDMVWGHASLRDPEGRGVWMKASGWSFDEIGPDRVVLVGHDGSVLDGDGSRHIEYPIHTRVMAARRDVGCVVHTHSPSAVSFASLGVPLRAISHDGVEFAEPQIPRFTLTGSLIRTDDLGDALAETIGDGVGALIPNHGLVTIGEDPAAAVMRALLLDRACRNQLTAMAAGELRSWSDSEELALKRSEVWPPSQLCAGYDYLCRKAGATES
ncbi:class II aldolase/adducin family protein [Nocardioides sp. KR10-350]|uniref:class II aldolase/adducin family protein n=1 Tax=Nocardioides cheoyonin TaxID=3156615 RepID=UPI0032B55B62